MWNRSHGMAADYFALGVVTYELMMKVRPYEGMNKKDCQCAVFAKEVQLTRANIPPGWSSEAADFINKVKFDPKHSAYIESLQTVLELMDQMKLNSTFG